MNPSPVDGGYLQVGAPLGLPLQQGVQDAPARLAAARVVPAHHVVGGPDPPEELLVHVLGAAVVRHVGQVYVDRRAGGDGRARLLGGVPWKGVTTKTRQVSVSSQKEM